MNEKEVLLLKFIVYFKEFVEMEWRVEIEVMCLEMRCFSGRE